MRIDGASEQAVAVGADKQEGIVNYLIGNDPSKWHTEIPTFARVRLGEIYPGVDMVYYGKQGQLEYDFVVKPGADASRVSLAFDGADSLAVEAGTGDLLLNVGGQTIRQQKPVVYQETDGVRREVESGYSLKGGGGVGFTLGAYDTQRPLIIDPVLAYSTYLGGSGGDSGAGIAVDSSGNAYVAGQAGSTNFPVTAGAFQTTIGGSADAFVTKLNASGSSLVYSTYVGGTNSDFANRLAIDSAGSAYITGVTFSTNFPTANAIQSTKSGSSTNGFVTKLNAGGSALLYSTYLGGSGNPGSQ
jgi:hypothetical protein